MPRIFRRRMVWMRRSSQLSRVCEERTIGPSELVAQAAVDAENPDAEREFYSLFWSE